MPTAATAQRPRLLPDSAQPPFLTYTHTCSFLWAPMWLTIFQFVHSALEPKYYRGSPIIPIQAFNSGTPNQALHKAIS